MITVVIPSYKNKEQIVANLKKNLPHIANCEVIIINDDPTESIKNLFKGLPVKLIENNKNLGFGGSINKAATLASHPYIMLLNSDVVLHDKNFEKITQEFKINAKLFAVSFAQKEKDNRIVGKNSFYWDRGMFFHKKAKDITPGITGWAEGGSCLIDKKKFLQLAGFDSLYSPFYWEDIDLSYRAWKRGFEIYFDPSVMVTHYHESTIGKYFSKGHVKKIAFRNQFFFMWKNISDFRLIFLHILFLPFNMVYYVLKEKMNFVSGFFSAVQKINEVVKKRISQNQDNIYKDVEILKKFHE